MKSWYWRTNAWKPDSFLLAVSRLAPCVCSRLAASAWLSPTATSTPSLWATSLASIPAIERIRPQVRFQHNPSRRPWCQTAMIFKLKWPVANISPSTDTACITRAG